MKINGEDSILKPSPFSLCKPKNRDMSKAPYFAEYLNLAVAL